MRRVIWVSSSYDSTLPTADDYLKSHDPELVQGVYLNLRLPQDERPTILDFLQRFPWAPGTCTAGMDRGPAVILNVQESLDHEIARANRLRPPNEPIDLSTNYGRLTLDYAPGMKLVAKQGWWPAALIYKSLIDLSDGYWTHRYDDHLPTAVEALQMTDAKLNQSRSLVTDDDVGRMKISLESQFSGREDEWEMDPFWATLVLGFDHLHWTFAGTCSSSS